MRFGTTNAWKGSVAHPTWVYRDGSGPYSGITVWIASCGQEVRNVKTVQPDSTKLCAKCVAKATKRFVADIEDYLTDCSVEDRTILDDAVSMLNAGELELAPASDDLPFQEWARMSPKDYVEAQKWLGN